MKTITMMTIGLAIGTVLCAPTVFAQPGGRAKKSDKASEKSARPTPLITGETAPPFVLKSLDGKSETDTSSFRGQRPIILFFGSYTWPPFLSQVGSMEKMYQEYKDIAEFRIVYIHEAHAADSDWAVKYAKEKGINNATNYGERCSTAKKLVVDKSLTIPFIVDDMDNKVNEAYRAWPDRIFLIRKDGRLAVAGKRGPWGYKPALDEAGKWLAAYRKTGDEPVLSEEDLQAGMKADEARAASQKNDEKIGAIEKKDDRPLAHYTSEYPMGRQHNRPIVEKDGKTLLWAKGNPDGDDAEWFDMTDSLIDPVKLQFGIGKDRIPSIDEPEFAKPGDPKLAEAGINDSTIVVGFEHDGVAKAYPIAILNGHEVVNDTFKGQPFAVCWWPLAQLAAVCSRKIDGETLDIGTTGYTLNNVFVLYDRNTGTVWYPLREGEMNAVAGPDKGKRMDFAAEPPKMPLSEWVKKHPGTVVMLPGPDDFRRGR